MKVRFDPDADTLTIQFVDEPIEESDELRPGVIADYSGDGRLVRLEMLDASQQVDAPGTIEFSPGRK